MEPSVVELDFVRVDKRLWGELSSYMFATFFRVPFCRSGRKARVTQWMPRTLVVKLSARLSLSTLANRPPDTCRRRSSHRFNSAKSILTYAGIVDQDVQSFAFQLALDFGCGFLDGCFVGGIESDSKDPTRRILSKLL